MGTLSTRKLGMAGLAVAAFAGISLFSAGEASALTINSDYTLESNVTDGIVVEKGVTATLNLNGYSITNTKEKQAAIINEGNLTIVGDGNVSTDQAGTAAVTNKPDATITISGGTYSSEKWYIIRNYGHMTINPGVTVSGAEANAGNASMVTNGWYGAADANNGENIAANSGKEEPQLIIHGGNFIAGLTNCSVIKNDDYGNLTINGGSFSQPRGSVPNCDSVILNWHHATIYGGEFFSENGPILSNGAFSGGADDGIFLIEGGTYTTGEKGAILGAGAGGNSQGTLTIQGGTFSKAPVAQGSAYDLIVQGGSYESGTLSETLIPEGYVLHTSADGTQIVLPSEYGTGVFDHVNSIENPELAASNEAALQETAEQTVGTFIDQFDQLHDNQEITLENGAKVVIGSADKIRVALSDGYMFILHLGSSLIDLSQDLLEELKPFLPTGTVIYDYRDYSLSFDIAEYATLGYVSELPNAITLSYDLNGAAPAAGYEREWFVIRLHDGEIQVIDAKYDAEADRLYFDSDKFSTYLIAYRDTQIIPKAPNTGASDTTVATTATANFTVAACVASLASAIALAGAIKARRK